MITCCNNIYTTLKKVAYALETYPMLVLKIEGHTDNVGSRYRNLLLSEDRTISVEQWLIKQGIDTERVDITGHGPDQPIHSNETKEGRAQNRRVEMSYSLRSPLASSSEASE